MDSINIKGLEVFAHHGVYREENVLGQKFVVDVSMQVSTQEAGRSDDIRKKTDEVILLICLFSIYELFFFVRFFGWSFCFL